MDAKMEKHKKITDTNVINTVYENNIQNPDVIVEKKKRGRKKNIKLEVSPSNAQNLTNENENTNTTEPIVEKKIRKRRSKKNMALALAQALAAANTTSEITSVENTNLNVEVAATVKVRKRRVCKSKNNVNSDTNTIIDLNNPDTQTNTQPPEEKVVKKRGRKPKGGKIITQKLEENNNNNEMPNIILHLKCSLSDIKNTSSVELSGEEVEKNEIQSYNNLSQLKGSDIYTKNEASNTETKKSGNATTTIPIYNDSSSHLFKVYDPVVSCINNTSSSSGSGVTNFNTNSNSNESVYKSNEILNNKSGLFNSSVYSPDINLYDNEYDDCDDVDSVRGSCKNEKEIWRKINQLKVSFHKSDICKNTGGTQRSACFWCTCEFDSPAIYIPKTLSKDVYNVYGCFCSPECSAAFLMNENIDTSTKFERYHLLNSLYGKIYKYEKSIKIAPNPFYLLNKFYGNLTIQEYRKLFQSEQMIYVVNKPLTHILPELYEDNNDFLLNNKIIPTNSVNIKKNKPLKSNIINNAFGITVGGN